MMRETVIEWAHKEKIIAIVRGIAPEKCLKVAQALYDGGFRLMEITYDQKHPEIWEETAKAILAGILALIRPVITSTDGRCVATIR